jgi:hypothetical protein
MPTKHSNKKERGRQVTLPPWWIEAARRHAEGWTLQALATALTDVARRSTPWDRTTVGDFLKNLHPTQELMEAMCALFELPWPVFTARSYEEADQMQKIARRYDVNPERAARLAELDAASRILASRRDQIGRVDSVDGKGSYDRRLPRGVGKGGKASS